MREFYGARENLKYLCVFGSVFGSDNENLLNATQTEKTQAITKISQMQLKLRKHTREKSYA